MSCRISKLLRERERNFSHKHGVSRSCTLILKSPLISIRAPALLQEGQDTLQCSWDNFSLLANDSQWKLRNIFPRWLLSTTMPESERKSWEIYCCVTEHKGYSKEFLRNTAGHSGTQLHLKTHTLFRVSCPSLRELNLPHSHFISQVEILEYCDKTVDL